MKSIKEVQDRMAYSALGEKASRLQLSEFLDSAEMQEILELPNQELIMKWVILSANNAMYIARSEELKWVVD